MIAPNGHIKVINYSSDYDADGLPVQNCERIGTAIPCNYSTLTQQLNNSFEEANYTTAGYSILIDESNYDIDCFVLYNKRGKRLCTCKATSVEYLDEVEATKIIASRYAD